MIKAHELRIGNLVRFSELFKKLTGLNIDLWEPEIVIKIEEKCLSTDSVVGAKYEAIEGIPITEVWLLKFGFRLQIGFVMLIGREFQDYSLEISHNDKDKWYCYFRNFNKGELDDFVLLRNDLKYIHQLQNIYFALTQTELEIINE